MNAYAAAGASLLMGVLSNEVMAERKYSDWRPAVSVSACGAEAVNSAASETGAAISKDGLSLYFGSTRPGGVGNTDLYVARRTSQEEPWGAPVNLGPVVNSSAIDNIPSFSRDGHWLFFNSSRTEGSQGGVDIWVSYRAHVHDDFAWEEPQNLGPGVNSALFDAGSSYFENEDGAAPQLYFNRGQANGSGNDIMMSELQPDGTFGPATLVDGINSPQSDQRPSIRFDGLELFFFSNRDGNNDIWVTTRNSVADPWSPPVKLGPQINTAADEAHPHISPDGLSLFFSSTRPGCGGFDLYMSTRAHLKGKDKE
jgi:Tol biopolymer transport system component